MDTQRTVADVRALLYPEVDASDPNAPLFLQRLNEVCERYMYSGKWKGMIMRASYATPQRFLTLSRWHYSLLALRYRKIPRPVFGPFLTFTTSGPGELMDTREFPGILVDLGDGYCTQSDIVTPGTLRVTITAAGDAAKTIRLFGEDQDGNDIFDSSGALGINLTTANPTANTTVQFSKVTGIQAPSMVSNWTLSVVNGSTVTQIGGYWPGETRPSYHRYQTGIMEEVAEGVQVLVQRRFVPMLNETDWVIPGNLSALRLGLQALAFEFATDQDRADKAWASGLDLLNQEAIASRGAAIPTVNFLSEFSYNVQIGS